MRARPSSGSSQTSMPAVVVLIPPNDGDSANTNAARAVPRPILGVPSSSSSPSASSTSLKLPYASSSLISSSTLYPSRQSPPKSRRPLIASSSASSESSSSSSRRNSGSLSSGASATSHSSHRSRNSHHDQPVDPANPFGVDVYQSAKRAPPSGQGLYVCQWRLREKKNIFDTEGHKFCCCSLMTADILAKHVLSQHVAPEHCSTKANGHRKIACKWGGCFNRQYDPSALAAHLVHDHLTLQLGLKFACIAKVCNSKMTLTSEEALHRHHAVYHPGANADQLRPIWQPRPPPKDKRRAASLLNALRRLDLKGDALTPKIAVSDRANPKDAPLSPREREWREVEFKRRKFDPQEIRPGSGQNGQPWLRLHKRLRERTDFIASVQAADEAILRATEYDDDDLESALRGGFACVELDVDPTVQNLERGIERAQLYDKPASSSSSSQSDRNKLLGSKDWRAPQRNSCQVLVPTSSPQDLFESIGPASLASIEREMNFDASLSKQRRWVEKIRNVASASSKGGASSLTQNSTPDTWPDFESSSIDWAPPLRLDPYHPASRRLLPIAEDNDRSSIQEKPRAIKRRVGNGPESVSSDRKPFSLSSSPLTIPSTRETTPAVHAQDSASTLLPQQQSSDTAQGGMGVKRERVAGGRYLPYVLDDGPPTSRMKLEHGSDFGPAYSKAESDLHLMELQQRPQTPVNSIFIEIEPNAMVEFSPSLSRNEVQKQEATKVRTASSKDTHLRSMPRQSLTHDTRLST